MLNLNDAAMIKQNKYMLNGHVGYTGVITCIMNETESYIVTFENNERELYYKNDLVNVSEYEHNEVS